MVLWRVWVVLWWAYGAVEDLTLYVKVRPRQWCPDMCSGTGLSWYTGGTECSLVYPA